MAISNSASGFRPGVCTSTTRPTAPYEGQMIYETDTDRTLIWNNSVWIVLSKSGDAGLIMMRPTVSGSGVSVSNGMVTVSAATEAIISDCFTTDFDFYRLMVRYQTSTTNQPFMQLRTGSTNSANNYNYSETQAYLGFGVTVARSTGQAQMAIGTNSNGAYWQSSVIDIFGPRLAEPTTWNITNTRNDANYGNVANYLYNGNHSTATAYESMRLFVSSGTITAKVSIYGYNQ